MTSNNLPPLARLTVGVLAAATVIGALVGCTAAGEGDTTAAPGGETSASTETPYVPEATEGGAAIISSIADCAQVGGYLGSLIDGLAPSLEAVDAGSVFCDWGGNTADEAIVSVEVTGDGSINVPTAEVVTASGGQVIESAAADAKGGIVYSIPGTDGQAFALMAVLPEVSVSATAVGREIGDEQVQQLAGAVESVLSLGGE